MTHFVALFPKYTHDYRHHFVLVREKLRAIGWWGDTKEKLAFGWSSTSIMLSACSSVTNYGLSYAKVVKIWNIRLTHPAST